MPGRLPDTRGPETGFSEIGALATVNSIMLLRTGLLAGFAGFTSASSAFTDLSERLVLKMADAAAVFGNDVAVSAESVLVGR